MVSPTEEKHPLLGYLPVPNATEWRDRRPPLYHMQHLWGGSHHATFLADHTNSKLRWLVECDEPVKFDLARPLRRLRLQLTDRNNRRSAV